MSDSVVVGLETVDVARKASAAPKRLVAAGAVLVGSAVAAAAFGLVIAGGGYTAALPGLPDQGPVVAWGTPVLRTLAFLAAVTTIGSLLSATILDPSNRLGVFSQYRRRDLRRAAVAAAVWACLASIQVFVELANILGIPLSVALSPAVVTAYANEVPTTRMLAVTAVLAAFVAVGAFTTSAAGATAACLLIAVAGAVLPALAGHNAGLDDHALAMTAGIAHIAAAVLWMGGLVALATHAFRNDMPLEAAVKRFSVIALASICLVALSGAGNAVARLDALSQLLSTSYGLLILAKTTLILVLAGLGWFMRRRIIGTLSHSSRVAAFARIASLELVILAVAVGLGVALASSPTPGGSVDLPSHSEHVLGFCYPPASVATDTAA